MYMYTFKCIIYIYTYIYRHGACLNPATSEKDAGGHSQVSAALSADCTCHLAV